MCEDNMDLFDHPIVLFFKKPRRSNRDGNNGGRNLRMKNEEEV